MHVAILPIQIALLDLCFKTSQKVTNMLLTSVFVGKMMDGIDTEQTNTKGPHGHVMLCRSIIGHTPLKNKCGDVLVDFE